MNKLFNVSVKFPKAPRERKWAVHRYAVVHESAAQAERAVRDEYVGSREVIDICAREIEGGVLQRDTYLDTDGRPFARGVNPPTESPIYAEPKESDAS